MSNTLSKETKEKVEKYLRENENAHQIEWEGSYCSIYAKDGCFIDNFIVEYDEDGVLCLTSQKNWQVTITLD